MHKWDPTKMAPKESGDTIKDCIEYVRRKMYITEQKPNKPSSDGELEVDSESENVLIGDMESKDGGEDNVTSVIMSQMINSIIN